MDEALLRASRDDVSEAKTLDAPREPEIQVRGLHKTYDTLRGPVEAVRNVSFEVQSGEFVSLIGPSGCGKSTILHIVAGLIPYDSGQVAVGGGTAEAGRRDVGIMLQKPVLLPWRSVISNVLLPAELFNLNLIHAREQAKELLQLLGLEGFEDKHPWELSGGMQQRCSLARLLLPDPTLLLMDEPFAALDELTRERLNGELARVHETLGRSILYVTHNIPEAVFLSDQVVVLKAHPGEVLEIVEVDLPRPRTADLISDPRTAALAGQIRDILGAAKNDPIERPGGVEKNDG